MPKVDQSIADLEKHLMEQISFLQASANAYDGGFYGEATSGGDTSSSSRHISFHIINDYPRN